MVAPMGFRLTSGTRGSIRANGKRILQIRCGISVIVGRGLDGIDVRLTRELLRVCGRYRGPRLIHVGFKNDVYEHR